jgi:carbon storage regulator
MLVLSRQMDDETVLILPDGREVVATVVSIVPGKVRIGWTAPADVRIHRREVYDAIKRGEPRRPAPETLTYPTDNAKGERH